MTGTANARAARVVERLDTLFDIGRDAGTNRPGLGEGEQRAHDLVAGWMREAGLDVTVDGAGKSLGRAPGAEPSAGEVWTGSHLDTPPDGGRFDGALGVVTALDVAEAIHASGGAAEDASCQVEILPRWCYEPVQMHPEPAGALRRAIAAAGVEPVELPSGAGHDAAILATAGVPAAMLFVRSDAGGVSHAPEESTGADAVALAVDVLEAAIRELAG